MTKKKKDYSKAILDDFNVNSLIAIDRDPISKIFGDKIKEKYQNFELVNDKFSNIDKIINKNKLSKNLFDIIIFDLGISSNQIEDSSRGFSFLTDGPLNMDMGLSGKTAFTVINNYKEEKLAEIIFKYGEERYSRQIAKEIIKSRKFNEINSTLKLANIIQESLPKKFTKLFIIFSKNIIPIYHCNFFYL